MNAKLTSTIMLAAVCLGCSAMAVAPAPDGGYTGNNTAEGTSALFSLTSGTDNTALGFQALFHDNTGPFNTATGFRALFSNTSGQQNTATGLGALLSNTTGNYNTATGVNALYRNTTGGFNTATGRNALFNNTTGTQNTANGYQALYSNTSNASATGSANTALGYQALYNNTTGTQNIALGWAAGHNLTGGNLNIDIGNYGNSGDDRTIYIGEQGLQTATFIAGIYGGTASGGTPVYVNSAGQLGTSTSSKRFKQQIKPMDKASKTILALNPVTFRYKKEIDPEGIPQFGLVAEEVAKVNPDLIVRDKNGEIYTVRYDAVNAMLLNEFLKEHKTVQELRSTVAEQENAIEELTAQIRKVSAQIALMKTAPQIVQSSRKR